MNRPMVFRLTSLLLVLHVLVGLYVKPYRIVVAWPPAAVLVLGADLIWPTSSDNRGEWFHEAGIRAVLVDRISYVMLVAEAVLGYWLTRRFWGGGSKRQPGERDDRWIP